MNIADYFGATPDLIVGWTGVFIGVIGLWYAVREARHSHKENVQHAHSIRRDLAAHLHLVKVLEVETKDHFSNMMDILCAHPDMKGHSACFTPPPAKPGK